MTDDTTITAMTALARRVDVTSVLIEVSDGQWCCRITAPRRGLIIGLGRTADAAFIDAVTILGRVPRDLR